MRRKYEQTLPSEDKEEQQAHVSNKRQTDVNQPHAMDEQEELQHAVGNAALRRIMRSVASAGSGPLLPREQKEAGYARWLLPRLAAEGQEDWLRRFYALTLPQKRAALRNTLGNRELEQGRYAVNGERFGQQVKALKDVELRHREAEREADDRERGASAPYRELQEDGMLSPYREIVRFLHYKANKQGKATLMQRFSTFSTAQKQLAIHRMMQYEKLSIRAFTHKLNISVLEREWVDWAAVQAAMDGAERMLDKRKQANTADQHSSTGTDAPRKSGGRANEDEIGDTSTLPASLLALLGIGDADHEDAKDDRPGIAKKSARHQSKHEAGTAAADQREEASDQAAMASQLAERDGKFWASILLGAAGAVALDKIVGQYRGSNGNAEAVVDRYLQIDRLPSALRTKRRMQRLKTAGFHSVEACLQFLLRGFATYLARGAMKGKDLACRKALRLLAIADGSDEQATADQILRKITQR